MDQSTLDNCTPVIYFLKRHLLLHEVECGTLDHMTPDCFCFIHRMYLYEVFELYIPSLYHRRGIVFESESVVHNYVRWPGRGLIRSYSDGFIFDDDPLILVSYNFACIFIHTFVLTPSYFSWVVPFYTSVGVAREDLEEQSDELSTD